MNKKKEIYLPHKKETFFFLILSFLVISNYIQIFKEQGLPAALVSYQPSGSMVHECIKIDGDAEMDEFFAGNGTNGSALNPYIIEDFDIVGDLSIPGIEIRNCTRFLLIRNNSLQNVNAGVKIKNCSNIKILNNSLRGNDIGIDIDNSNLTSIYNNNFSEISDTGIFLINSHFNNITNNTIPGNILGLILRKSNNNSIVNNTFRENYGGIDLSNSHNNSILDNEIVSDLKIEGVVYSGISVFYSNGNTIANNYISFNHMNGIVLGNSSGNDVFNNIIDNYGYECIRDIDENNNNNIHDNQCINPLGPYNPNKFVGLYVVYGIISVGGGIAVVFIIKRYFRKTE